MGIPIYVTLNLEVVMLGDTLTLKTGDKLDMD